MPKSITMQSSSARRAEGEPKERMEVEEVVRFVGVRGCVEVLVRRPETERWAGVAMF